MPLFVNRDQIFAHQVHLLEHKLRSKEERILELETENALLHLRLAECLGKLRRDDEDILQAQKHQQHQKRMQKSTHTALAKLLSDVQVLKQDLRDVFAVYVSSATELEEQSRELQERVGSASCAPLGNEEKERCKTERLRRKLLHNALVELRGEHQSSLPGCVPFCPLTVHQDTQPQGLVPHYQSWWYRQSMMDSVLVNCSKSGTTAMNKMFEFERVHGPEDSQEAVL
ncbi:hypothetical protein SKAU_G00195460 [Synaphobranchus kaupii]|uniref:Uncharacterized protein n=1 Tax=Synaphobranchus kaupii TaxID=118154 RepID=A0A9Q1IVL8_SYNKA|nr:hypothetical protein SKAU_G00195460 [Synaphobranchus kaupii]